jgi:hypothetical protein
MTLNTGNDAKWAYIQATKESLSRSQFSRENGFFFWSGRTPRWRQGDGEMGNVMILHLYQWSRAELHEELALGP